MVDLSKLSAPFPKDTISWRAQHFTKEGDKALALAYIDARDVMNRLDDVCGIEGWQCRYPIANEKTICEIGIYIEPTQTSLNANGEWIWKADGAGDTDIEAEKGAISDAFKRAAVKWGIGRYLYDLDAVWVPCKAVMGNNNKWVFKEWIVDPWTKVRPEKKAGFETAKQQTSRWVVIKDEMIASEDEDELIAIWKKYQTELAVFKRSDQEIYDQLETVKNTRKSEHQQEAAMRAGMPQDFNNIPKGAAHG